MGRKDKEWTGDKGADCEPIEANPDNLGKMEHQPTAAEEAMRYLLDHPVERVGLLGTFGEGVFMTVFVDGLTLREAEEKLGKSRETVRLEAVKIKTKIKRFIDEEEAKDRPA